MSDIIQKITENKDEFNFTPTGKITEVLVYHDRAVVTREIEISLKKGKHTIMFENLTPILDDSSIKAFIPDSIKDSIRIVGIHAKDKALVCIPKKEERTIYNQIITEIINLIEVMDNMKILEAKHNIIEQLSKYVKDGTNQVVMDKEIAINKLSETLNFLQTSIKNIDKNRYDLSISWEEIEEKIRILENNLNQIRTPMLRMLKNVYVELEANNDTASNKLGISYVVTNTNWSTYYDARLVETSSGKHQVNLTYYGVVSQRTGEDWINAKVSLTTAKPTFAQIPDIYPSYFTGYKKEKQDKVLISQQSAIQQSFAETESAQEEYTPEPIETPQYSDISDVVINKTFRLEGENTILSDGNNYNLTIFEGSFLVNLSYETVPKLIEYVYLKGEMKNETLYPFLNGKVNIFRKSGFIGSSSINYVAPNETFELSFGIDEDIKVRRILLLDDLVKDKVGFNQHRLFGYNIELTSFKEKEETVVVKENIPVSEIKEVKVKIGEKTTKGYEHDEKEGILVWKSIVNKGEKKNISIYYEIEASKSFNLLAVE